MKARRVRKSNMLNIDLNDPNYRPERLIHAAKRELGARTMEIFADMISMHSSGLSYMCSKTVALSPLVIVRIMDRTKWSIDKVRELAGIPLNPPQ